MTDELSTPIYTRNTYQGKTYAYVYRNRKDHECPSYPAWEKSGGKWVRVSKTANYVRVNGVGGGKTFIDYIPKCRTERAISKEEFTELVSELKRMQALELVT